MPENLTMRNDGNKTIPVYDAEGQHIATLRGGEDNQFGAEAVALGSRAPEAPPKKSSPNDLTDAQFEKLAEAVKAGLEAEPGDGAPSNFTKYQKRAFDIAQALT